MGQGFIFLNIDKRQQVRCGGAKYGETFLEPHTPAKLIKLLAVPEMGYNDGSHSLHRSRWASILPEEDNEPRSWAGDRIICIGELLQDWPESILAADNCKSLESPHFLYWNAVQTSSVRALKYSGNGVLRNLTKKIYVRAEGIPTLNNENKWTFGEGKPIDSSPGLGQILMSRIGWSQDRGCVLSMCWEDADTLTQGEWAGDRFDVRSYEEVKGELNSGDWIDVTDQEAQRFIPIWEAE